MKNIILLIPLLLTARTLSSQSLNRLNLLFNNSSYLKTIKLGEQLIKSKTENPEIYYITGISYLNVNKFKEAEDKIKKAYLIDNKNIKYINSYAHIFVKNNNSAKAINLYKKTLQIDSLNFNALNSLSKLYINNNKYKDAIKTYEVLLKQDSLNSYYYRKIGYCFFKQKNVIKSIDFYKKAYMIDSTNIQNIKALSIILYKEKKYDEAIEYCDKGILTDSTYAVFYRIKGDSFYQKNHYNKAITQYKTAILLGDSTFNTAKRLGSSLCRTQKYEEALNYNLAVYKADTTNFSATFCLSRNYLGLKDYLRSIEFSENTIKLLAFERRVTSLTYDNMAAAYKGKKEYTNALKMYNEKYKVLGKRYLYDYYNIALLYDKLDYKKEAIQFYNKVIENSIDKTSPILNYSIKRITVLKEDIFFNGN